MSAGLKLLYTYLWLVNVLLSFCIFSGDASDCFKRAVDVWFHKAQIIFWILFEELGGLLTPFSGCI